MFSASRLAQESRYRIGTRRRAAFSGRAFGDHDSRHSLSFRYRGRTGSLWFLLGLDRAWNWAQSSMLGLPVSGSERIARARLLQAMNAGPDWLTGWSYGIEGGAACTLALLISTLVIWRTKLFSTA